jgi:hypothetical protein
VIELAPNILPLCLLAMSHISIEDATLVKIDPNNFQINSGELELDYAPSPVSTHASDLLDNQLLCSNTSLQDVLYSILDVLDNSPFSFMDVLLGLFYGDKTLRTDLHAKSCWLSMFSSDCLYMLLRNMVQPPRTKAKGTRAKGAEDAFRTLAYEIVASDLRTELDEFGQTVYARKMADGSGYAGSLGNTSGTSFIATMLDGLEKHAPKLTELLTAISEPEKQRTPLGKSEQCVSHPNICMLNVHICN